MKSSTAEAGEQERGAIGSWIVTSGLDNHSENVVELRGFEPLTSCMPYKFRLRHNMAGCGSTSSFNRPMSLAVA